jgi:hypothetical protein
MDVSDYCQDHGVPLDPLSTPHTDRLAGGLSLARKTVASYSTATEILCERAEPEFCCRRAHACAPRIGLSRGRPSTSIESDSGLAQGPANDTSMKAPDLGCRGFVDNSPLISCEGVGERHLFFIQRPLTVGVCAKLLTRHEKSWPGSLTRGFLFEVGLQHLAEYLLDRVRGNSKLCKSGHVPRSDVIDLHEIDLIASHGRTREHL